MDGYAHEIEGKGFKKENDIKKGIIERNSIKFHQEWIRDNMKK